MDYKLLYFIAPSTSHEASYRSRRGENFGTGIRLVGHYSSTLVLICAAFLLTGLSGCASSISGSESQTVLTAPILLLPINGSDTADSVLLDWDDIPDAKQYEVQVSTNRDFTQLIHESRVLDRSENIVAKLTRTVPVYWRIRAGGRDGLIGPWSAVQSFTPVRQAFFPAYPSRLQPPDGKKGMERNVMLRWEPVPDAISYHLVVTIDEEMRLFQVDLEDLKTNSYFVEDLVLTYPYWWKIRSLNAAGFSDWSPVWVFEVKFHEN